MTKKQLSQTIRDVAQGAAGNVVLDWADFGDEADGTSLMNWMGMEEFERFVCGLKNRFGEQVADAAFALFNLSKLETVKGATDLLLSLKIGDDLK